MKNSHRFTLALAAFLLTATTLHAQPAQSSDSEPMPNPGTQAPQSFQREVTQTVRANYLLFLPEGYDAENEKRWPLILFLHGAGERGHDLEQVKQHGPPKIVQNKPDFPFIVVSPQCPPGSVWSTDVLLALLDEILENHAADPKRVYLTGLSMGGFGSWALAAAAPERFAAIAPICGGGSPISIWLAGADRREALRNLPVWAFHGAQDTLVRPEESERIISAFRRIGNSPKLTIYPDAAHDSWTETYNNPDLYRWFLEHQR